MSSPKIKNISLFRNENRAHIFAHPALIRRASAVVTDVERGAMDVRVAPDTCSLSVRQRRVVPTPRRWRPCTWETFDFPGRDGGKSAVLRGEHVISRKAIAQGRPGVLRCPVCSCASCFVPTAHGTAGAARTRSSLRPLFGGQGYLQNFGRIAPRECETISRHCEERLRRSNPSLRAKGGNGLLRFARNDVEGLFEIRIRRNLLAPNASPKRTTQITRIPACYTSR
jgi:hypothetical protein